METLSATGTTDISDAQTTAEEQASSDSADEPGVWHLPPRTCRITGFLGPQAAGMLLDRALALPADALRASALAGGKVRPQIRRSLTGHDFRAPELETAIHGILESVEEAVGIPCREVELDYTLAVHNDGDFYGPHQDRGSISSDRLVTFVYYLHRTPRPFTGGQLRIFDAQEQDRSETPSSDGDHTWRDWEPDHDSIVFFDPAAHHEVRPVSCPSGEHGDSRITVTGWFYPAASAG